jgi:hypothetical protein
MATEKRPKARVVRERLTLDGPWEWAFDRMMARKAAAEELATPKVKRQPARKKQPQDGA